MPGAGNLGRFLAVRIGAGVGFLEIRLGVKLVDLQAGVAGFLDLAHFRDASVLGAELELVDDFVGEQVSVAGHFDTHLGEHL